MMPQSETSLIKMAHETIARQVDSIDPQAWPRQCGRLEYLVGELIEALEYRRPPPAPPAATPPHPTTPTPPSAAPARGPRSTSRRPCAPPPPTAASSLCCPAGSGSAPARPPACDGSRSASTARPR